MRLAEFDVLEEERLGDFDFETAVPAGRSSASARAITAVMSSRRNWTGERFTATRTSCGQVMHSAQARRNTHSPISTMSPISSATGMNSDGGTMPRTG